MNDVKFFELLSDLRNTLRTNFVNSKQGSAEEYNIRYTLELLEIEARKVIIKEVFKSNGLPCLLNHVNKKIEEKQAVIDEIKSRNSIFVTAQENNKKELDIETAKLAELEAVREIMVNPVSSSNYKSVFKEPTKEYTNLLYSAWYNSLITNLSDEDKLIFSNQPILHHAPTSGFHYNIIPNFEVIESLLNTIKDDKLMAELQTYYDLDAKIIKFEKEYEQHKIDDASLEGIQKGLSLLFAHLCAKDVKNKAWEEWHNYLDKAWSTNYHPIIDFLFKRRAKKKEIEDKSQLDLLNKECEKRKELAKKAEAEYEAFCEYQTLLKNKYINKTDNYVLPFVKMYEASNDRGVFEALLDIKKRKEKREEQLKKVTLDQEKDNIDKLIEMREQMGKILSEEAKAFIDNREFRLMVTLKNDVKTDKGYPVANSYLVLIYYYSYLINKETIYQVLSNQEVEEITDHFIISIKSIEEQLNHVIDKQEKEPTKRSVEEQIDYAIAKQAEEPAMRRIEDQIDYVIAKQENGSAKTLAK